ncbi:MAG TPA: tetratricopeptide repeat protein [Acidobacteriota bacterium]|nr:tetratricopeptide repeat protein [Acidobacteriota bacterium]
MKRIIFAAASSAVILSLVVLFAGLASAAQEEQLSRQERLWQHRNLGKAYYENTVTQPKAIEEFAKALELAPDSARERLNYALALLRNGETDEAVPRLIKIQQDHPELPHTWFNLGVYYKREGEFAEALRQFEGHRQRAPGIAVTHYNLGLLYRLEGRLAEARESFRQAIRLDHMLAAPHFQLSNLYRAAGEREEASRQMEIFRRLKEAQKNAPIPEDLEWSIHAEIFDPVDAAPPSSPSPPRWMTEKMGQLQKKPAISEVFDPPAASNDESEASQNKPDESDSRGRASPAGPLREREPSAQADANRNEHDEAGSAATQPPAAGGLSMLMNQEGQPMLLAWNSDQIRLYQEEMEPREIAGMASAGPVFDIAVGDVDDDGRQDAALVQAGTVRLLMNGGQELQVLAEPLAQGDFHRALWLDFDHDYDLDLFLFGRQSRLLRNEGQRGFADRSQSFPFRPGAVADAVFHDHVKDWEGMDLVVSYADGSSAVYLDQLGGKYVAEDLAALPAGARRLSSFDVDNDGHSDLLFTTSEGLHLLRRQADGYVRTHLDAQDAPYLLVDASNRGWPDLFIGASYRRNLGRGRFGESQELPLEDVQSWLAGPLADAFFQARPSQSDAAQSDAAGVEPSAQPHVLALSEEGELTLLTDGTAASNWIQVELRGERNLRTAHHGEVEVKAGSLYQKRIYRGRPLHFGLGHQPRVDTVRITWPNGLIQNEPLPETETRHSYREAKQLSGSCPMVFTWDGEGFRFINDILGVAPLGASAGDGRYFQADHDEYIQIPGDALVERGGRLEVRLTEELREVAYLDQVRLVAVDHPSDLDIYTSDRFKAPPFPEFRLYGVGTVLRPRAARHFLSEAGTGTPDGHLAGLGQGQDVLASLLHRDAEAVTPWLDEPVAGDPRAAVGPGASSRLRAPMVGDESRAIRDQADHLAVRTRELQAAARSRRLADRGILPEHVLELDFGPQPALGQALLVMHGWLDWADASTFVHSDQSGRTASPPRLELLGADGQWRVLVEDLGAPAGKWKTIAVPIALPSNDGHSHDSRRHGVATEDSRPGTASPTLSKDGPFRLRIVTSWAVHWDEIFLSPDVEAPSTTALHDVPLARAVLDYRGFSKPIVDPQRRQPDTFDYQQWLPWTRFNQARGRYTRLGRVDRLLSEIDDRFVIMGAGDELRLSFEAGALPQLPPGHSRQYLLFADGWVKDGDLNTAHSSTVEPLPFHGMSAYPYGSDEHYPDTELHRRYLREDLTRPAVRQFHSLTPDARRASSNPQNDSYAGGNQ